jgi:amino acid transporter
MSERLSAASAHEPTAYAQDLARSLTLRENVMITLSSVTPASSVFIIVPAVIAGIGGASALAFAVAAIAGIFMAYCYSELSSAFPVTGGEYAFAARTLGRATGFALFTLTLIGTVLILGVIALGTGDYLGVAWPALSGKAVGVVVLLVTMVIAILNIRTNAWVTGIFLAIELIAVAVLAVLGIAHISQPVSTLWTPRTSGPGGALTAVSWGLVSSFTATALFAYNGYGTAVYFAEETRRATRMIGRAIMVSLAVTVAAELIPLVFVLLGTPSLPKLLASPTPMNYFLLARGGRVVNVLVSLGIALAIFNAVIAIMLQAGRLLFASARDRSWPDAIGNPLARVHPRLRTPVLATLVAGLASAIVAWFVPLKVLIIATGANVTLIYLLVGLSALVGRARGRTSRADYRMPAWPLAPLLVLAIMAYVIYQSLVSDWVPMAISLGILAIGYAYYALYLRPRRADRWTLPDPVRDEDDA